MAYFKLTWKKFLWLAFIAFLIMNLLGVIILREYIGQSRSVISFEAISMVWIFGAIFGAIYWIPITLSIYVIWSLLQNKEKEEQKRRDKKPKRREKSNRKVTTKNGITLIEE